jgi:hypothetical protein
MFRTRLLPGVLAGAILVAAGAPAQAGDRELAGRPVEVFKP